jgi:hypothetical protein
MRVFLEKLKERSFYFDFRTAMLQCGSGFVAAGTKAKADIRTQRTQRTQKKKKKNRKNFLNFFSASSA